MSRTACLLVATALLTTAGCASDGSSDGSSDAAAASSPSATPSVTNSLPSPSPSDEDRTKGVEVSVSIADGKVSPKPRRVKVDKGSRVRLLVTSDVDDVLHLHVFEIEEPLEAGRTTTVKLVADQSGIFEVEAHESGLSLLQLEVR